MPLESRPRLDPDQSKLFHDLESPDQTVVGVPQVVFTREENTFSDLAREYGLGYDELVAANPDIDPWLPGDNTPVLLPTQYVSAGCAQTRRCAEYCIEAIVLLSTGGRKASQTKVMTYPIGIGRVGWETPLGETTVVSKARGSPLVCAGFGEKGAR